MMAETRRTHVPPAERIAISARCGGDEADTCVCSPQYRAALSALGGGDEADTCVCLPQKRAAPPAHDGGDERSGGDTCVCFPQTSTALSAHGGGGDGGDEADICVCSLQCSPYMVAETMLAQACAARRRAQRSPHMAAETRWTRACTASIARSDERKGWEEARHYLRLITGAHSAEL